jgi:transposase
MTKTQVEVITSVQRRRYWSRAEKERIVAAALEPGAVASDVARAAGIHTTQLFRWRQQLCERAQTATSFNAVAIAPEPDKPQSTRMPRSRHSWRETPSLCNFGLRPIPPCGRDEVCYR